MHIYLEDAVGHIDSLEDEIENLKEIIDDRNDEIEGLKEEIRKLTEK